MLKALELVGFKSFADRTRFDFPDGITVVVGPNGSGKSNVVDAVKWVLGAQSAKSLRGADMADCIFKGSAAGGRKPSNSAEAILILENSQRHLNFDADEVQVSRRVFRSGEGEYAINGQPCRLKDVRDLFRGTGVGVDSYSLIEQGKVDRLLQSSPKERRGIFEEAAGISRFKAKKVEAERRLTRVDQNMLRLNDIVDEVGKRLSVLKNQATKAQRFREMTDALRVKRIQMGCIDQTAISQEHERSQASLQATLAEVQSLQSKLELLETDVVATQLALASEQQLVDATSQKYLDTQRELIAAENGKEVAQQRNAELIAEREALQSRIDTLVARVTVSSEEIDQRNAQLAQTESELAQVLAELGRREQELEGSNEQLRLLKQNAERTRSELERYRHEIATLQSQWNALEIHAEQASQSLSTKLKDREQLILETTSLEQEIVDATRKREIAERASSSALNQKIAASDHLQKLRRELLTSQESVVVLQGRMHGVTERLHVLEQLEDQFAGAGRGGQQLLRLAKNHQEANQQSAVPFSNSQGWGTIRGLVADIVSTELHLAPLIDVALGSLADAIVLSNGQIVDWITDGSLAIEGRVTLLRLDRLATRRSGEKIQLDGLRGVIGRADRLTQFDPAFELLVRSLLGSTWFVDTLTTALELSHFRGAGLRFVTAECQLVESDGSITLGSLQTGLGLVSRRSEMQAARSEIAHVEQLIEQAQASVAIAQGELALAEQVLQARDAQAHDAARELTACDLRLEAMIQKRSTVEASKLACEQLLSQLANRLQEIESDRQASEAVGHELQLQHDTLQHEFAATTDQIETQKNQHRTRHTDVTEKRIELARLEQRLEGMRLTIEQLLHDTDERNRSVDTANASLESVSAKIQSWIDASLEASQRIESSKTQLEQIESQRIALNERCQSLQGAVSVATRALDAERRTLERTQDRIESLGQQSQLCLTKLEQLAHHYRDEYQIDLNAVDVDTGSPLSFEDRPEIEAEVIHLRHEIAAAGSVNMEALQELDELQSRYDKLFGHQQDLLQAKAGLFKTLEQIDEDASVLFAKTLAAIRTNFQELYRKSFGGGFADIVLENEADPESGIEIIATPPGKTTLNNSLLSGGEKALTAVALIMAFFQYRPSPFCILDEVDAPFDEANIGRFVTVLREFLSTTKFIVVTHSKKTMTAANMIYGITMQESGVSRQVSVRFEEVNEQGEIQTQPTRKAA